MEFSDWQTQLSTVKERTQYAFKNSLFCDVEFAVVDSVNGGKVTIPANKYMLAVSSPVFEAMFYGNLKENNDTIDLQDCTKEGLQELLRFVHSDDVNLTGNNVMEVLYIANKYIMPFLVKKCRDYIQECLKPQEVFAVLPQLQQLSEEELEEHCWKVIDNKTQLAISSKPFLGISREMLYQLLTRDSLKIKELEIFQAVDRWAAKKTEEKGIV
ncbi:BTB/POZ domain-containing protein 6 [Exaiptasia diaphana]|nr:BTB/POZ domain-containing protein 6 [Exaiptasia diaphana]